MSGWRKEGGSNPAPRVGVMARIGPEEGGVGEWEWRRGDLGGNGGDVG